MFPSIRFPIHRIAGCFAVILIMLLPPRAAAAAEVLAAQPAPNAAQYRYWTTNWSFTDIDVGLLLSRLSRLGIDIPIGASGDVSVEFSVSVPINALGEGRAYRFNGSLRSNRIEVEDLLLADFSSNVRYENGSLNLTNLSTQWLDSTTVGQTRSAARGGLLNGEATIGIVPQGAIVASLVASDLSIRPLHDLILTASRQSQAGQSQSGLLNGSVTGNLDLSVPLSSLRDPVTWTMDADLQASGLTLGNVIPLSIDTGAISLREGAVSVPSAQMSSPANPEIIMLVSASADLEGDRPFEFDIKGNDVPLRTLSSLFSLDESAAVTGALDIDAQGSGQLGQEGVASASWDLAGRIASPRLSAFGVNLGLLKHRFEFNDERLTMTSISDPTSESLLIKQISANYALDKDVAELSDLQAEIFGGSVSGSARLVSAPDGRHEVDLRWSQIQPTFNTSFITSTGIRVSLNTSGEIQGSLPVDSEDWSTELAGTATVSLEQLLIGQENVGNGEIALQAESGQLQIEGGGELFGGRFSVSTSTPVAAAMQWFDLAAADRGTQGLTSVTEGEVQWNQLSLRRASQFFPTYRRQQMHGFLSGRVAFGGVSNDITSPLPSFRANVALENVAMNGRMVVRRLDGDLSVASQMLVLHSVRGAYAGGRFEAVGRVSLDDGRGRIQVRASAIDASTAMMPLSQELSGYAGGILSTRLSIETGPSLRANGSVELREASLYSVRPGNAHASVQATSTNDLSRWTVTLRSIESSIGNGRIAGEAVLRSSSVRPGAFDLQSQWSARRVDFAKLLAETGEGPSSYARGNVDGALVLNGTGIRSVADLTGRFDAELDGTQARSVPGLVSAQAYLGAFSLAGTRFDQGRVRGTIGSGVARIDEFWLVSDRLQVFADGRVQIPSGRMDVTAVISTGNFDLANVAIASITEQLAIGAVPPIALFMQVNRLLSDRTLYVDVIGPISDPRMRLKPLRNIQSGVGRFLVREATGVFLPVLSTSGVLANGQNR